MKTFLVFLTALWLIVVPAAANGMGAQASGVITVSPEGPYTTIQAALSAAAEGDTIQVHAGTYTAPLLVEKPVSLVGVDWPVIDGGGKGTVVTLAAPGITFTGFEVRGSGREPDRDHSGITITAPDVAVDGNRLSDVLFGIFIAQADRAVIRNNDITGKEEYDVARKGDGIRLWYSRDALVEQNHVHQTRDVVVWYSDNVIFRDNLIESGRYGLHLMYCNGAKITGNRLQSNSVGIFSMYSQGVELLKNDIRGQRGPSGYALGFKDANDILARDNILVDNRMGVFLDGTPYTPGNYARIEDNIIAYNDIGVGLVTSARDASFSGNTFWENEEQVSLQTGGREGNVLWSGNYWSEYTGFDADGDGFGDIPYHSDRFFESLTDRAPMLRALSFSPAVQAIEFAATSFPIFKPQPKLTDQTPLAYPVEIPNSAEKTPNQRATMALLALGLLVISGFGVRLIVSNEGGKMQSLEAAERRMEELDKQQVITPTVSQSADDHMGKLVLSIDKVTKRYGKVTALDEAELEVYPGQSIALWGANGAGKTTLLKAILGLIDYRGAIYVNGKHTRKNGKAARKSIGYVPQEVVYYDMSVLATLRFYAHIKKVDPERIPVLLDKVGLSEHAKKLVPALSGGLKQRLALAIALLSDPPLLLFDEPTANLDVQGRRDYLALLAILRKEKKTILFASHRLEEVEILADRVVMMEAGRMIDEIAPNALRTRLDSDVELILWLPDDQRHKALDLLENRGMQVHLNGRGTLVALIKTDQKLMLLNLLAEKGIQVLNFEIEKG